MLFAGHGHRNKVKCSYPLLPLLVSTYASFKKHFKVSWATAGLKPLKSFISSSIPIVSGFWKDCCRRLREHWAQLLAFRCKLDQKCLELFSSKIFVTYSFNSFVCSQSLVGKQIASKFSSVVELDCFHSLSFASAPSPAYILSSPSSQFPLQLPDTVAINRTFLLLYPGDWRNRGMISRHRGSSDSPWLSCWKQLTPFYPVGHADFSNGFGTISTSSTASSSYIEIEFTWVELSSCLV